MKKRFLYSIVFLLLCTNLKAQLYLNGINLNDKNDIRFLVVGLSESWLASAKTNSYYVENTQNVSWANFTDSTLQEKIKLYTIAEILNYVTARGWDFVQLSSVAVGTSETNSFSYREHKIIFRRSKE